MSIAEAKRVITPEELLTLSNGKHFELVDGVLVEKNRSVISGRVEATLLVKLGYYCDQHHLGPVFTDASGIRCFRNEPDKIRRPDAMFVKAERFTDENLIEGFLSIPPDLAAEVVSTHDSVYELEEKVEEYLAAGIPLVWTINPETQTVVIYRGDGTLTRLRRNDELTGEDIIPGFKCRVGDLFPQTTGKSKPAIASEPPK